MVDASPPMSRSSDCSGGTPRGLGITMWFAVSVACMVLITCAARHSLAHALRSSEAPAVCSDLLTWLSKARLRSCR